MNRCKRTLACCFGLAVVLLPGCPLSGGKAVFINPAWGTTYTEAQTVTVAATVDVTKRVGGTDIAIDRAEFYYQKVEEDAVDFDLRCTDSEAPFECDWDITSDDNGKHRWIVTILTSENQFFGADAAELVVDIKPPVRSSPDPREILFATHWGAATGKSQAALTDGNKMNLLGFPSDRLLTAVSLSDLGVSSWPPTGLEVSFDAAQNASLVGFREGEGLDTGWPAPAVGESIYYRMLIYNALPENSGVAYSHGTQSNIGAISHGFQIFSPQEGQFSFGFFSHTGLPDESFLTRLPANAPLRVEWAFHREAGPANARVEIRIYDERVSATEPQWTEFDFLGRWGEGPHSIGSDHSTLDLGDEGNGFQRYMFGTSGNSSQNTTGLFLTGFAVCSLDWCGTYRAGEGAP